MSAMMMRKIAPAPRVAAARVQAVRPVPIRGRRVITCAAVDKPQVLEDVRSIISNQLGKELSVVSSESKFVDLGADSLDIVEIMMALEEKFDISLDEESAEKIATVQQAADMIAAKIASK